ncbi:hypothetical protein WH47_02993 [Habropoda laboriosa]|uniref:Uncharacterized protein n=1 Tax=Habropoda laboriosa TaxID=597456 RepID=A0A0L7QTD1_9HYME|nr:hypothetical protein WH47_02993 [Habropoda laboriosa]
METSDRAKQWKRTYIDWQLQSLESFDAQRGLIGNRYGVHFGVPSCLRNSCRIKGECLGNRLPLVNLEALYLEERGQEGGFRS